MPRWLQGNQVPDLAWADEDGLVALGGTLSPERLLSAYRAGVFPWSSLFAEVKDRDPSTALQQELEIKLPLGLRLSNEKARCSVITRSPSRSVSRG